MKTSHLLPAHPDLADEFVQTPPDADRGDSSPPTRLRGVVWLDWANPSRRQLYRNLLTGLLLMLLAGGLYLHSVRYGFVYYDDVRLLLNHPELYGQSHFSDNLKEIFLKSFPREEPLVLRDLTWALDSRLFGFGNPVGYHLGNVLWHGMVVALLFAFLLGTTGRYGFALGISAAFLLLAIHIEPVAWIMGRKDILATLFMLLALCAQTMRLRATGIRAQAGWYVLTLVCFLAGLLCKYNVLSFFLVLYLHATLFPYLSGQRAPGAPLCWGRECVRETLLVVPSTAMSVLVYCWYSRWLAAAGSQTVHGLRHLWDLAILDPMCFLVYLQQTFCPWNPRVFYTWPRLLQAYPWWQTAASLGTCAGFAALGIWLLRRHKDLFFYYGAFFALMIPYLSLLVVGFWVAERYLYFAVFCLLALAASVLVAVWRQPHPLARVGVIAMAVVFVATNLFQHFRYQPAWQSGEALWQYHLGLPNPSPIAYENLAGYYYARAASQQGTPESLRLIHKMDVVVEAGLAQFWPDRQQPPPPRVFLLFFQKAIVQEINGNPHAALASLLTSLRLNPDFDATYLNLARLYRNLAHATEDMPRRASYALAARDRLGEYIARAFRNLPVPAEFRQEFEDTKAESLPPARPFSRAAESNGKESRTP